mmetsp:Transcript_21926/g.47866  ORF Transcript_21926/g.47866 Transcript_21926/m.47866 type:complete len:111 (+) Transcript_21926:1637-1969(+)
MLPQVHRKMQCPASFMNLLSILYYTHLAYNQAAIPAHDHLLTPTEALSQQVAGAASAHGSPCHQLSCYCCNCAVTAAPALWLAAGCLALQVQEQEEQVAAWILLGIGTCR